LDGEEEEEEEEKEEAEEEEEEDKDTPTETSTLGSCFTAPTADTSTVASTSRLILVLDFGGLRVSGS
jgi:UDP-N-acetylenolpyruvoylglucosamine reductase